MSYKGELQTVTELSMRYQIYPSETCHAILSESYKVRIHLFIQQQQFFVCNDNFYYPSEHCTQCYQVKY